ncbi:hypothetical protein NAV33_12960 [Pseudomonas stutzeri]|uniref:hypothetical protein n=1 Tax=Stutzerimonas stutzeri TaxID=316 RepID=UPI002109E280|nr:hypothetical protein [Stutzerimonas stutzeri]MCQ4312803.1 hypothetical protein [Stutzerimonas stutzeri]
MSTSEIFVVSAVPTAIGSYGGSRKNTPPTKLATLFSLTALERAMHIGGGQGIAVILERVWRGRSGNASAPNPR